MMQFDMFKPAACANTELAKSFTGGARTKPENRRAHRAAVEVAIKYGNDATKIYGVRHTGKDLSGGELNRKRGGAVGMMEGWREVLNEPVRQRNGLLQMSAQCHVED
jgi:hypothetical protein